MKPTRPHLIATEENKNLPVLIIDKKGIVGSTLADKLKEQFLVVLVSGQEFEFHKNIIHIPYRRKTPVIPDNTYSHIFVFYNGEEEILAILPSLIKKANSTNAKVLFLTPLVSSSKELFRRLANHLYHSMRVMVYGEVFDKDTHLPNMVNLFIYQARTYGRLEIPNEGLGKLYPVSMQDLLAVIIATGFSDETERGVIFVFPRTPFTEMSVARIFQKINPDTKIDFNRRKLKNPNYYIPPEGEYAFKSYNLEHGLKAIDLSHKSGRIDIPVKRKTEQLRRKRTFSLRYILFAFLGLLILPLVFILLSFLSGAAFLSLSIGNAEKGEFEKASQYAGLGRASFATAEALGANYFPGEFLLPDAKFMLVQNLRTGKKAAGIGRDLFLSMNIFSGIYEGKGSITKAEFENALASTKSSLLQLEEMKAQNHLPKNISDKLKKTNYMLTLFENTIDTYPEILGFNGKRKYLLLFQNNMELRPGGGFIGSYGLVEFDKGKMGKIEIHDVYDADGKLRTHVEPPFALRRYGGVSHWFLRDTNFDVNFTTNAAASADILNRSIGERVNGVIGVDTNFIKNILETMGPVTVADYKEEVNADNFYMLTQKHAEDNFFPGSTQKKDFLRALYNSLLSDLAEKKDLSYMDLANSVEKSIKEKHLLFAFLSPSVQEVFSANNLSGTLWDKGDKGANSFSDYFGTVDANIGANKGNYYLKRSITQNVSITAAGQLQNSATITFENTSKKDSKFGGDYKTYTRFILPGGAVLRSITIDGKPIDTIEALTNPTQYAAVGFVPPQELEIESSQVDGKEVVAFPITVPIQMTKKVTINYSTPQKVNTTSPVFSYKLRVFKQPGTVEDPYSLTLTYPTNFKPIGLTREIVDLGGKIRYEAKLNEDRDISIKFTQK